ncbi:endolytic transglycosylase MltG [Actinomadura rudentiformis]|uniref:Endolytic murein transglycosylase n=1 Tax=Actinomadura rudentiformis TaxID=359158 RepID=A0A6H9YMZ9_9ACTN|nr:endolytic transglycosylase MltG [Actinomadura rudentiformis]KAB2341097.1 endolytic transglycosylase MltG [Actinomadura rudentiformis]
MNELDLFSDPHGSDPYGQGHDPQGQGHDPYAQGHDPYAQGHLTDERLSRGAQRQKRKKQKRRKQSGRAAVFFSLAFIVALVGTGGVVGYAWLDKRIHPPDFDGAGAGSVTVQIKEGDSGSAIGTTLQSKNVVKSVRAFVKVYGNEPKASKIQPGFYQMRLQMSSKAAMALLLDPKSRSGNQFTVREGIRTLELFQELQKRTGIQAAKFQAVAANTKGLGLPSYSGGKLEGYLYPGRYDINPNASARQIIKQMVDRFNKAAADMDLEAKARKAKMTPAKVITMASLIQAEGGKTEDFPKIANVIYNRIKIGRPLQFDSTVLYVLNKRTLNVREGDINRTRSSPYNTYYNKGLTPGPISNPGREAIEAVMNPTQGKKWLFFIATDPTNQITEFAETEEQFRVLEAKFRAWQKANPGN